MRGKRLLPLRVINDRRLIPAHAGKTGSLGSAAAARRAHPRACGENKISFGVLALKLGSSPRMRGKQRTEEMDPVERRLIPAHAGKTWSRLPSPKTRSGSSPRMRGKLVDQSAAPLWLWLIPAHAGKTGRRGVTLNSERAHPRACGENSTIRGSLSAISGSSPRMRGKQEGS